MPIYHAIVDLQDGVQYVTPTVADGRKGVPILDITGFGAYSVLSEFGTKTRTLLGPLLPAPGTSYETYDASADVGNGNERLVLFGPDELGFPELLLEFSAAEEFEAGEAGFGPSRRLEYYGDGLRMLDFSDFTGSDQLRLDYLKVWAAVDFAAPDFWTNFILSREVP